MVQKTISATESKMLLAEQDAMKRRAARQAAKDLANPAELPDVECSVLPQGDGRISMGVHIAGIGEAHYEEGETFTVKLPIAVALYERGFVNFEGARAASEEAKDARRKQAQEARDAASAARDQAMGEDL